MVLKPFIFLLIALSLMLSSGIRADERLCAAIDSDIKSVYSKTVDNLSQTSSADPAGTTDVCRGLYQNLKDKEQLTEAEIEQFRSCLAIHMTEQYSKMNDLYRLHREECPTEQDMTSCQLFLAQNIPLKDFTQVVKLLNGQEGFYEKYCGQKTSLETCSYLPPPKKVEMAIAEEEEPEIKKGVDPCLVELRKSKIKTQKQREKAYKAYHQCMGGKELVEGTQYSATKTSYDPAAVEAHRAQTQVSGQAAVKGVLNNAAQAWAQVQQAQMYANYQQNYLNSLNQPVYYPGTPWWATANYGTDASTQLQSFQFDSAANSIYATPIGDNSGFYNYGTGAATTSTATQAPTTILSPADSPGFTPTAQ